MEGGVGMKIHPECITCLLGKEVGRIPDQAPNAERLAYTRDLLELFLTEDVTAPVYNKKIADRHRAFWKVDDRPMYEAAKKEHNALVAGLAPDMEAHIKEAADPLELAIKIARAGNYIDMAVLDTIDPEKLKELLEKSLDEELDPRVYAELAADLAGARSLVLLTDNCGEVVLDRLMLAELKKLYPDLAVTIIVKSQTAANDVTVADARALGLDQDFQVLGNGSDVPGTSLDYLDGAAREALYGADVILAKGQGNFETLTGCGLNIYYLFLCKCGHFTQMFGVPQFHSLFVRERDVAGLVN